MSRVRVATESEFESERKKIVEIEGVELGIFKLNDEYYALLNNCPHQNGPIARGTIRQMIVADVPDAGEWVEERYKPDTMVIRCPCHGWGFDIATGENMADPENAPGVPTYDVVVEDGTVYVEI